MEWYHARVSVTSRQPTEFIDITDRLAAIVRGSCAALVNVHTLHTTTGLAVNEHEPLLLADFESTLERTVPCHGPYHHDDGATRTVNLTANERVNGHAHCRALLLGSSVCLNVVAGRLVLGRWQRVFFVELDGPQERALSVMLIGGRSATTDEAQTIGAGAIEDRR